jgi:hypothetical protein
MNFKLWLENDEIKSLKDTVRQIIINFMAEDDPNARDSDEDSLMQRSTRMIYPKVNDVLERGEIKQYLSPEQVLAIRKMAKEGPGIPISRFIDEIVKSAEMNMRSGGTGVPE